MQNRNMACCPPSDIQQHNQSCLICCFCCMCSSLNHRSDQTKRGGHREGVITFAMCAGCPASDCTFSSSLCFSFPWSGKQKKRDFVFKIEERLDEIAWATGFLKALKPSAITGSPAVAWQQQRTGKKDFLFPLASSHLQSSAVRTSTVERKDKAATGNQDPRGIRANPGLPGLHWSVAYK